MAEEGRAAARNTIEATKIPDDRSIPQEFWLDVYDVIALGMVFGLCIMVINNDYKPHTISMLPPIRQAIPGDCQHIAFMEMKGSHFYYAFPSQDIFAQGIFDNVQMIDYADEIDKALIKNSETPAFVRGDVVWYIRSNKERYGGIEMAEVVNAYHDEPSGPYYKIQTLAGSRQIDVDGYRLESMQDPPSLRIKDAVDSSGKAVDSSNKAVGSSNKAVGSSSKDVGSSSKDVDSSNKAAVDSSSLYAVPPPAPPLPPPRAATTAGETRERLERENLEAGQSFAESVTEEAMAAVSKEDSWPEGFKGLLEVTQDKDCLFRAISKAIQANSHLQSKPTFGSNFNPHNIETVRKKYKMQLFSLDVDKGVRAASMQRMTQQHWASDTEIQLLSKVLELCIQVWSIPSKQWRSYYPVAGFACSDNNTIYITTDDNSHFNALEPL